MSETNGQIVNAMTVDVEDYYQVQAFAGQVRPEDWGNYPSRVERNTERVLELFERHGVRATFFTLGWVAERHKPLVRRIVDAGHELASHGYQHRRADSQTPADFRNDVVRTKSILEDVSGRAITGYRAASFSIGATNLWAHDVLAEAGYRYSSSIYPVSHDIYGMPDAPRFRYAPPNAPRLVECPMTSIRLFGRNLPASGGGYFRLLPYALSRWMLARVNREDRQSAIFYFHPWEIDPDQPRDVALPWKSRFRHYTNLSRMEGKLDRALSDFRWGRMDEIFLAAPKAAA